MPSFSAAGRVSGYPIVAAQVSWMGLVDPLSVLVSGCSTAIDQAASVKQCLNRRLDSDPPELGERGGPWGWGVGPFAVLLFGAGGKTPGRCHQGMV